MNSSQISPQNSYKFEYSIPYFLKQDVGDSVRVSERVRKSVVFIGVCENGDFKPRGTGFIVTCQEHGRKWLHLVTAQHVIVGIQENHDLVHIRFNTGDGRLRVGTANVADWFFHPDATNFNDVAITPFNPSKVGADFCYIQSEGFITDQIIQDMDMGAGDDVFVTGLFASHYGQGKNVPIVRTGTIAAMPEEPVWTNSGYMDAYLIEGRSIGGLSGSPVFFQPAPFRIIEGKVRQTEGMDNYLIGLVHGHFDVKEIIDIAEDEAEYAKNNKLHSGIAIVVPAEKIVETLNQPDLKKMREETVKKAMADSVAIPDVVSVEERSENPSHKEDFIRLLGEAVSSPPTDD